MTELKQVWKCNICGNIVEIVHDGSNSLVCCEQPMNLMEEKGKEQEKASGEKHVPVIQGKKVIIGKVQHPMLNEHYIEWIEATSSSKETTKIFLKPGMKPEAEFCFNVISARAYCNVHGLWKS